MQPIQHITTTKLLNEGEDLFINYILPHLSARSLCNCSQACKALFKYAEVEALWKKLCKEEFSCYESEGSYKHTYKQAYLTACNFRQGRFTLHSINGLPNIEHYDAFCMHNQTLCIAKMVGPLIIKDLITKQISTISVHRIGINKIQKGCIATNGNYLCIGYENGYIDIYNLKDAKYEGTIDKMFEEIDQFVLCNNNLVIKFDSNKIDTRDITTRELVLALSMDQGHLAASSTAAEEKVFFIIPNMNTYYFNVKNNQLKTVFESIPYEESFLNYTDNRLIFCNGKDIYVADLESETRYAIQKDDQSTVSFATCIGTRLLVKQRNSIAIWDLKTKKSVKIVIGEESKPNEIYMTHNKIFWKSIYDREIKFYDFSFINNEVLLSNISNSLKSSDENKKIAIGQFHALPEAIKNGIYAEFLEILSSFGIEFSTGVDTIFKEEKNLCHIIQAIRNYIAKGQNSASIEQG